MRLGIALPQFGPFSDPALVTVAATEAESMGYDSLWAGERVHAPADPLTPYPGGGSMPEEHRSVLDPLFTLTLAASVTSRARLGTSTLNAPLHPPVILARRLADIDRLSGGRLNIGLGLGWSLDEYHAVAVPWEERGARLDETIDVLDTLYGPDPVSHTGRFWTISPGGFQPKPVQRPRPPLYLGGAAPAALRRIGQRADGWLGVALPPETLRQTRDVLRGHARDAGRDPSALRTMLRINPQLSGTSGTAERSGGESIESLCEYLRSVAELGVEEAFIDLQFTTGSLNELLETAGKVRSAFTAA